MFRYQGKHRVRFAFLKFQIKPRLEALAEYFVGPLPA